MTTYQVHGFKRDDSNVRVTILVDASGFEDAASDWFAKAEKIAGDQYCLHASENVSETITVPDDAKNVLFMSDEELYAKVPDLNWRRRRRKSSRRT